MSKRFIVKRYREGERAPSLSLSYSAETRVGALVAHFERYERLPGARYVVAIPGEGFGEPMMVETVQGSVRIGHERAARLSSLETACRHGFSYASPGECVDCMNEADTF